MSLELLAEIVVLVIVVAVAIGYVIDKWKGKV